MALPYWPLPCPTTSLYRSSSAALPYRLPPLMPTSRDREPETARPTTSFREKSSLTVERGERTSPSIGVRSSVPIKRKIIQQGRTRPRDQIADQLRRQKTEGDAIAAI